MSPKITRNIPLNKCQWGLVSPKKQFQGKTDTFEDCTERVVKWAVKLQLKKQQHNNNRLIVSDFIWDFGFTFGKIFQTIWEESPPKTLNWENNDHFWIGNDSLIRR